MHVGIAYLRWRGKRSRHSRRMRTRNFAYLARGPWRVQIPTSAGLLHPRNSMLLISIDSFTFPLHSPNARQMSAVRAVQGDCHWGLKNGGNSHRSRQPIMQWATRQSQSIFRPTNYKSVMTANKIWWLCLVHISTTRFASDVGYRIAKNLIRLY